MTSRRKRFRKFLMSYGLQRNEANVMISAFDNAKKEHEKRAIILFMEIAPHQARRIAKDFLPDYRLDRKERRIQF